MFSRSLAPLTLTLRLRPHTFPRRWLLAAVCAGALLWLIPAADGWNPHADRKNGEHPAHEHAGDAPPAAPPKPGDWEAFVDPEGHLFPSLLLATATLAAPPARDNEPPPPPEETPAPRGISGSQRRRTPGSKAPAPTPTPTPDPGPELLGDSNGLVGVALVSPADGAHAQVRIKENALMSETVAEFDLPRKGVVYHLMPKVDYKYDALNRVHQSHPLNVSVAVQLDGRDAGQRLLTARVHPVSDCPYAYQNPDDEKDYVDIAWMFAAYVNEDHPAIPKLLSEAQATGIVDGFDAYQANNPGRVLLQAFAVWEALRQHGIKYSDIGTTTTESDSLYTLHVRFIEETLGESHANCVDASVLLASILRRMGIDTFLVLEPGHMFLGLYLDREGKQTACLETTMLGDPDPLKCAENRALAKVATAELRQRKGWRCFNDALDSATKEFNKHRRKFEKANDPEYEIVDIAGARRQGIAPIGYVQPDGTVTSPPAAN